MTWLRLDDAFPSHPKVAPLSDAAFRLHVTAMAYCSQHTTDGRIDADILAALPAVARGAALGRAIAELEKIRPGQERPAWKAIDGGWEIHDFLAYNPSAATVKAEREAARLRMQRARSARVRPNTGGTGDVTSTEVRVPPARGTGRDDPSSAESVAPDTAREAALLVNPRPEPTLVEPELEALLDVARRDFAALTARDAWYGVISVVWRDVCGGAPPVRKLEPLDALRTGGHSLLRIAKGLRRYLVEKRKQTDKYGLEDFVAHLNDWVQPERKPRPPAPPPSSPQKPERTPEAVAAVRDISAALPWNRGRKEPQAVQAATPPGDRAHG